MSGKHTHVPETGTIVAWIVGIPLALIFVPALLGWVIEKVF